MKWSVSSATALLVLTMALTGCNVRIDTPPPALETNEPSELSRQTMALAVDQVIQSGNTDARGSTELLPDAHAHLAALGGVWQAPQYYENASESGTSSPESSPMDLADAVQQAAQTAQNQIAGADPSALPLYASLAIYYYRFGVEHHSSEPVPGPDDANFTWPDLPAASQDHIIMMLDRIGAFWEREAAQAPRDDRNDMAAMAAQYRSMANDLAYAVGKAGTPTDPRLPLYAEPVAGGDAELTPDEVYSELMAELITALIAALNDAPTQSRDGIVQLAQYFAPFAPADRFPGISIPDGVNS